MSGIFAAPSRQGGKISGPPHLDGARLV